LVFNLGSVSDFREADMSRPKDAALQMVGRAAEQLHEVSLLKKPSDSELAEIEPDLDSDGPKLAAAARATQLTVTKEPVNLERVRTYHQHRVPPSTKRRPSLPAKGWGGPPRFNDVVTLASPTKKGDPAGLPSTSSSPSMTPNHLHVVSQGVVQHTGREAAQSGRHMRLG
jgi:hypothetical protein